jgi:hypothetical protein
MLDILANPYFAAIGIPLILLISRAFARKLVRGSRWKREDFFLGIPSTFAAISVELLHIFELIRLISMAENTALPTLTDQLIAEICFLVLTLLFLLAILSIHQDWEDLGKNPDNKVRRRQFIWLGVVSNFIGSGLIFSFVVFIKGVQ